MRFHSIYWPCFLWSLDLPLPKKIFGHPWLLMNNDKMSKSKGNVIYADELVEKFGVDAVRYYLLHEIPYSSDGNITYDLLIERINGDLANVLGNLVQRTISMGNKYFDGIITNKNVNNELDDSLIEKINSLDHKVEEKMDNIEINAAITEIFNLLRASNKYIDETTPWVLAKDSNEKDRLETVIYNLLESIRISAVFLSPYLPETSENIMKQINNNENCFNYIDNNKYELIQPTPLFKRVDPSEI